jgi:exodeoxyribonuclease V alpha subunit
MTTAMQEGLGPLGLAFHRQVAAAGVAADVEGVVALAAALLMTATVDGHICLSPEELAQRASEVTLDLDAAKLRAALGVHPWATGAATPLVFENDKLYLRRFRDAEVRLAKAIGDRLDPQTLDDALPALRSKFQELFPPADEPDWQGVAVAACLRSRFTLITGGPGTGKTTTARKILDLLRAQNPDVRVAFAAPTGKAAARLGEAIGEPGVTLHRLLGYIPHGDTFRHNATDPLEYDVVIVDEASMVPLLLMDTLFAAVRADARVILLGDHDQLASVEAGSVLADLVAASGALGHDHSEKLAKAYEALGGPRLPVSEKAPPMRDAVVRLVKSHRFDDTKGIGALARAIRDGDGEGALRVLAQPDDSVTRVAVPAQGGDWLDAVTGSASAVFTAESPEQALEALGRVRVLCATNHGPTGTDGVIKRIEQALRERGYDVAGPHYRGRPLLVTRNDYMLKVFNGDIGVVWDSGDAGREAFIASTERMSGIPLPQLPEAVTAWAMTVHKSQGSEFDTVVVMLPEKDVRVLSRELLYTAVTRAKLRVVVVGPDEMVRAAVGRTARRGSGLANRFRDGAQAE